MPRKACESCKGTGLTFPLCDSDCKDCDGTGQVEFSYQETRMPKPLDENELVRDICDIEDLSDWEASFAESIAEWVGDGRELTEKQASKAREIIARYE